MAFRVSPDEDREIETAVRLSGLTKQDYITRRLLCRDVVVQGNPRVYKALRGREWRGWGVAGHHPADRRHHGRHEGGLIDG